MLHPLTCIAMVLIVMVWISAGVMQTAFEWDEITQIREAEGCIASPARFVAEFTERYWDLDPGYVPNTFVVFANLPLWALHCTPLTAPPPRPTRTSAVSFFGIPVARFGFSGAAVL